MLVYQRLHFCIPFGGILKAHPMRFLVETMKESTQPLFFFVFLTSEENIRFLPEKMWGEAIGTASGLGVLAESLLGFIEGVSPYRKPSLRNGGNLHNNHPSHQLIAHGKMQGILGNKTPGSLSTYDAFPGPKRWWFSPLFLKFLCKNGETLRL